MLNFVICDDEKLMVNRLAFLFEKSFLNNDFDAKIAFKTTDPDELLTYISSNIVNVVILDIEFNGSKETGLDLASKIRTINKDCYIIFITSHFEHLAKAYHYKTFDYLFKNAITVDSITDTLTRLFDDIYTSTNNFYGIDKSGTYIDLNDVHFIEKQHMKLIYHCSSDKYEVYNSFIKIESDLPGNFMRCHKSYIANINNILSVKLSENKILFKNGSVCYIGPKYKTKFMEVFSNDAIVK